VANEELEIVGGPAAGRRIPIGDELVLGREAGGVGTLEGDTQASRRHARIYRAQGALAIEDLGSTNGTFVNGARLTGPQWLQHGDQVQVGNTVARVAHPTGPAQPVGTAQQQPVQPQAPAQPVQPQAPVAGNLTLTVASGPLTGTTFPIAGELQFGRLVGGMGALGGDIRLSRRHARVVADAQGNAYVEDLQSSNGTFVNGQRIAQAQYVSPGDRVFIGSTEMLVQGAGLAAAQPGSPFAGGDFGYAPPQTQARSRKIIAVFAATLGVALVGGVALVAGLAPSGPDKCETKTACKGPPSRANALVTLTHYTAPVGFRVAYDPERWTPKSQASDSITLEDPSSEVLLVLRGVPGTQADTQGAMQQRIDELAQNVVSLTRDTRPENKLLGPTVGFRKGFGRALIGSSDTSGRTGVVVMAAGDGKLNVVATVVTAAQSDDDRQVAFQGASSVVNTVRWGDEDQ
jgi:pSer/pThr/pTyr-binding forkhead associated (FHA) protein